MIEREKSAIRNLGGCLTANRHKDPQFSTLAEAFPGIARQLDAYSMLT